MAGPGNGTAGRERVGRGMPLDSRVTRSNHRDSVRAARLSGRRSAETSAEPYLPYVPETNAALLKDTSGSPCNFHE